MAKKSNYKRLGDYIRLVDVRNRDLAVDNLVGLTIEKAFIPSVANTIGTDLSNYKVISNGQFACSLMQVSRDGKMPIAMFKGEKAIMSPAYPMFEVYRKDELLPEFLMMWFSRKEFDREVTFWAVGGVRGSLTWEDFENLNIPVPPIEEQRKIVAEYQAVERRIDNNRRLIATLESAVQTIYRQMFVDNIDPENLPKGWHIGTIGEFCNIFTGKKDVNQSLDKGKYPFFSCAPIPTYSNEYIGNGPAILIAGNGSYTGRVSFYDNKFDLYQRTYACELLPNTNIPIQFLYFVLKVMFEPKYMGGSRGTSIPYIVRGDIFEFTFAYNQENVLQFTPLAKHFLNLKANTISEIKVLEQILNINLSQLSKIS